MVKLLIRYWGIYVSIVGCEHESRSPRIAQARVRLAIDTLPQTLHRAGALCTGYALLMSLSLTEYSHWFSSILFHIQKIQCYKLKINTYNLLTLYGKPRWNRRFLFDLYAANLPIVLLQCLSSISYRKWNVDAFLSLFLNLGICCEFVTICCGRNKQWTSCCTTSKIFSSSLFIYLKISRQ